jgi:kynureninase
MHGKHADRLIVRDVRKRLKAMDDPDWRQAVIGSWAAHPDWFSNCERRLEGTGEMLQSAGVELIVAKQSQHFDGNEQPAPED